MYLETGSRAVALAGLEQKALFREPLQGAIWRSCLKAVDVGKGEAGERCNCQCAKVAFQIPGVGEVGAA